MRGALGSSLLCLSIFALVRSATGRGLLRDCGGRDRDRDRGRLDCGALDAGRRAFEGSFLNRPILIVREMSVGLWCREDGDEVMEDGILVSSLGPGYDSQGKEQVSDVFERV